MRTALVIACASGLILGMGCKKDDKDDDSKVTITENVTKPTNTLNLALDSMASVMKTDIAARMVGATTLDETAFTENDCDNHADPKARDTDPSEDKDNNGRLRQSNPRAALQSLYCKMQKDTKAADSFLGALSENKMLFCIMGEMPAFNGVAQERTLTKEVFKACAEGLGDEDIDEMTSNWPGDSITANITASAPPAFGNKDDWDASIQFTAPLSETPVLLRVLLRDRGGVVAMAVNNNADREEAVDGYLAAIKKDTGEVYFESKFQRIRSAKGESQSNGWNRHARVYVKGKMDANLKFESVEAVQGLYSDISINPPGSKGGNLNDPLQMGTAWTVKGGDDKGFKSHAYELNCSSTNDGQTYTCPDANLAASWKPTSGSGACNGALSGQTCNGDGIEVKTDADTAFFMDLDNSAFEKTEAWFDSVGIPTYTDLELKITQ